LDHLDQECSSKFYKPRHVPSDHPMCCRIAAAATQGIKMEHQLRFGGVEAAGSAAGSAVGGTAQLSGGQRTLLSLALILAVSSPNAMQQCSRSCSIYGRRSRKSLHNVYAFQGD